VDSFTILVVLDLHVKVIHQACHSSKALEAKK